MWVCFRGVSWAFWPLSLLLITLFASLVNTSFQKTFWQMSHPVLSKNDGTTLWYAKLWRLPVQHLPGIGVAPMIRRWGVLAELPSGSWFQLRQLEPYSSNAVIENKDISCGVVEFWIKCTESQSHYSSIPILPYSNIWFRLCWVRLNQSFCKLVLLDEIQTTNQPPKDPWESSTWMPRCRVKSNPPSWNSIRWDYVIGILKWKGWMGIHSLSRTWLVCCWISFFWRALNLDRFFNCMNIRGLFWSWLSWRMRKFQYKVVIGQALGPVDSFGLNRHPSQ